MTSYLVLVRETEEKEAKRASWRIFGSVEAASASAAIKASLNGADEGGTFVAVPSRSWQPATVAIEKTIKIG